MDSIEMSKQKLYTATLCLQQTNPSRGVPAFSKEKRFRVVPGKLKYLCCFSQKIASKNSSKGLALTETIHDGSEGLAVKAWTRPFVM